MPQAFQIRRNTSGHAVFRHKEAMSHTTWLPTGFGAEDVSFAPRLLCDGQVSGWKFVVPNVLPTQALRTYLANQASTLALPRAIKRFPDEAAGAATAWWQSFLDGEDAIVAATCVACVAIRRELSTIVIHQLKGQSKDARQANNAKASRRTELLAQLGSHECTDVAQGKRDVPAAFSSLLLRLQQDLPRYTKQLASGVAPSAAVSGAAQAVAASSEVDVDEYEEPLNGLEAVRKSSLPSAYTNRHSSVRKGDLAIVLPDKADGWMGHHPFWVVKVTRMTNKRHWLHFYGPDFLGSYRPLHPQNQPKGSYIEEYRAGDVTYIHWGFKLSGGKHGKTGKLKVVDLRVVSLHSSVSWQLTTAVQGTRTASTCAGAKTTAAASARAKKRKVASSESSSSSPSSSSAEEPSPGVSPARKKGKNS